MNTSYFTESQAYDVMFAVQNLLDYFEDLAFYFENDSINGLQIFSEESMEISKRYRKAAEACQIYLHTLDFSSFLCRIKELGYFEDLKKFIPSNIVNENLFVLTEIKP